MIKLIHLLTRSSSAVDPATRREFFIPKKWIEQEYVTFLSGCKQLAPRDVIINNMSLPDVELQDLIAGAEKVNKLYAHFVNADWNRDHDTLAHLREDISFNWTT
ncbi:hypothetical protein BRARA_D00003 [Brassica rapa]|uniref:Uncharacterized protein n=1 Tax=Brassica campestris TaxID=3711 RepID=A0A397ZQ79_BRACM|nr:hypothetical protein BRARA_D00003 [Brassica rapa]